MIHYKVAEDTAWEPISIFMPNAKEVFERILVNLSITGACKNPDLWIHSKLLNENNKRSPKSYHYMIIDEFETLVALVVKQSELVIKFYQCGNAKTIEQILTAWTANLPPSV